MYKDEASLIDIDTAAQYIMDTSAGLTKAELLEDEDKVFAIIFQLIVIGEATKRLSVEFRRQHSSIPWKKIAGMRDVMAHQYDKINTSMVWAVVKEDIPALKAMIAPLFS